MDGVKANWLENGREKWGSPHGRWTLRDVAETGSTNADLLAAAASGAPDLLVLRTDHQTAGRGRLGRSWEAPPGTNLLVSILFRSATGPVHRLTQLVGSACVLVLREEHGVDATLKWPNDVVVAGSDGERKLAGILAQASSAEDGLDVVVGMGVNVGWAPPPEVAPATCVTNEIAGGRRVPAPHELLLSVLDRFDRLDAMSSEESFATYKGLLSTIGRGVRCEMPDGTHIDGRAVDVEHDGRLQVLDECAVTHRIDTADVVHLRRTD